MKLFLWFTLFTICSVHFTHAGIYRRYVRRNRPRPPPPQMMEDDDMMIPGPFMIPQDRFARREFQIFTPTPWPSFLFRRARSAWAFPSFGFNQQPRMNRRFRQPTNERQDTVPNFHHQPTGHHYPGVSSRHPMSTTPFSAWRPLDYGNPIDRDPTFDYAPPSVERVRFHSEQNRRTTARSNTLPPVSPFTNRPPPPPPGAFSNRPSLWKMLAHKQRPQSKRPHRPRPPQAYHHARHPSQPGSSVPYHHHNHNQVFHDEAEIFPRVPNMVYFRPNDMIPPSPRRPGPQPSKPLHEHHSFGFPPRHPPYFGPPGRPSTNTQLSSEVDAEKTGDDVFVGGSLENWASNEASWNDDELQAVKPDNPKPSVASPSGGKNKEYLFTVVGFRGPATTSPQWSSLNNMSPPPPLGPVAAVPPTTTKKPTLLHAVKTTPITITTTHNSVGKPFEPTESLEPSSSDYQGGHKNHHHQEAEEEFDESAEGSETIEKVIKDKKTKIEQTSSTPNKKRIVESDSSSTSKSSTDIDKLDMVPPAPIFPNSFNILDSVKDENDDDGDENNENSSPEIEFEPENEIPAVAIEIPSGSSVSGDVKPRPVFNNAVKHPDESYKTSTSVSVSVSKDRVRPTKAPTTTSTTTSTTTTPRTTTTTTTTTETPSTTSSSTTTTPKPTKFPRLPTMPTYKKKPTPVYARKNKNAANSPFGKYSSSSSSSSLAKEMNGSGEIVVITAGRSKVKEYKPQFIGESSQLLAFDKVADGSSTRTSYSSIVDVTSTPSPSTSTTKSPLQEFDPMQLLHSWFTKPSD